MTRSSDDDHWLKDIDIYNMPGARSPMMECLKKMEASKQKAAEQMSSQGLKTGMDEARRLSMKREVENLERVGPQVSWVRDQEPFFCEGCSRTGVFLRYESLRTYKCAKCQFELPGVFEDRTDVPNEVHVESFGDSFEVDVEAVEKDRLLNSIKTLEEEKRQLIELASRLESERDTLWMVLKLFVTKKDPQIEEMLGDLHEKNSTSPSGNTGTESGC